MFGRHSGCCVEVTKPKMSLLTNFEGNSSWAARLDTWKETLSLQWTACPDSHLVSRQTDGFFVLSIFQKSEIDGERGANMEQNRRNLIFLGMSACGF